MAIGLYSTCCLNIVPYVTLILQCESAFNHFNAGVYGIVCAIEIHVHVYSTCTYTCKLYSIFEKYIVLNLGIFNYLHCFFLIIVFHPQCVDEWLQKWQRVCPLCKSLISRRDRRRERSPLLRNEGGEESGTDGRGTYGSLGGEDPPEVEVSQERERDREREDENELNT